jgi:hypothetical protein
MTRFHTSIPFAILAVALLSAPLAVHSEPDYAPPAAGMNDNAAAQVSDQQIEQFVVAFTEVRNLQQQFTQQLEGVTSQEEAQVLQQQAQQQMIEAVEEAGLSVADYNMVVAAMEQDEALRDSILGRVE